MSGKLLEERCRTKLGYAKQSDFFSGRSPWRDLMTIGVPKSKPQVIAIKCDIPRLVMQKKGTNSLKRLVKQYD